MPKPRPQPKTLAVLPLILAIAWPGVGTAQDPIVEPATPAAQTDPDQFEKLTERLRAAPPGT